MTISCAMRLVDGLQGPLFEIDISEIIAHEGDEPNAVTDFLGAEKLNGEHPRDVGSRCLMASL